jgi:N-acetylglucosamine kinase-like BadF-type ATPase
LPRLFLGVDGGQSSTVGLIGDETGRVIGAGRCGPTNHVSAPEARAKFIRVIGECLRAACAQAGLDPADTRYDAACLGFSGGPEDKESALRLVVNTRMMLVTNDALIALTGATGGEPGIITIAGTGSIAYGRNAAGETARAGGWGYIYGDEGSGFDIARQALRAALRSEEGWGPPTGLLPRLLEAGGARTANDLLHLCYTDEFPRARVATFARLVDEEAARGDRVAVEILRRAAEDLARLAAAVRAPLFAPREPARVAYIGGVFNSRTLLESFRALVEREKGNRLGPPQYGPAAGALLEAYRAAGIAPKLTHLPEFKK